MKSIVNKSVRPFAAVAVTLVLTGCAGTNTQPLSGAGQVKQIITCQLKADADPSTVLAAASKITKLPAVQDVSAGYAPKIARTPATSGGETVTILLSFRNEAAMADTLSNAEYQRIREQELKPLCNNIEFAQTTLQSYLVAEKYTEEATAADLQRRSAAARDLELQRSRTK